MSIRLVEPNIKYKDSLLEARDEVVELNQNNEADEWYLALQSGKDVEDYIERKKKEHLGTFVRIGWVPTTTFWVVDNSDRYIGKISLRHHLNETVSRVAGHIGYDIRPSERKKGYADQALKLCLEKAKEINLDRVMILCDEDNIGSKKVIEKNGGEFLDKIDNNQENKQLVLRYWINLQ